MKRAMNSPVTHTSFLPAVPASFSVKWRKALDAVVFLLHVELANSNWDGFKKRPAHTAT